jgi:hypothetical protein
MARIGKLVTHDTRVFDKNTTYDDDELLLHDSCGGGLESVEFFKHIDFTTKMRAFFRGATENHPIHYNAIHIRHTDMKVDSVALMAKLEPTQHPLFIGTDDTLLKKRILATVANTFSTDFATMPTDTLHYLPDKGTLEWAMVDLLIMIFAENTMKMYYDHAGIDIISGFCRLIDALKPYKTDLLNRISNNAREKGNGYPTEFLQSV